MGFDLPREVFKVSWKGGGRSLRRGLEAGLDLAGGFFFGRALINFSEPLARSFTYHK